MKNLTNHLVNYMGEYKRELYVLVLAIFTLLLVTSCQENCTIEQRYTYYEPVYTSVQTIRESVQTEDARTIQSAGKIFFKGNYLYINAPNEGVHIIDNSDPSNPINRGFINIPGSVDLSIKGNYLYSDSYMDLVIIDISDIDNAKEIGRVNDVFDNYNSFGYYTEGAVVTDWVEVDQITAYDCDEQLTMHHWGYFYRGGIAVAEFASFDAALSTNSGSPGVAGSMSRFALSNNTLYVITESNLTPMDLTIPEAPVKAQTQYIDWGIETLFPSGNNLFIGANDGMHIMDLTDPLNPELITTYEHVSSCDPVIVDGDHAFVTLRSGTECAGFTDQLEVINIQNLSDPQLEYIYPMHNPHGLGKDGDLLFICDGDDGLKIYNSSDLSAIDSNMVAHYPGINAFDIIPYQNVAMMIGQDGLYQYDYSDINNIRLLSKISYSEF